MASYIFDNGLKQLLGAKDWTQAGVIEALLVGTTYSANKATNVYITDIGTLGELSGTGYTGGAIPLTLHDLPWPNTRPPPLSPLPPRMTTRTPSSASSRLHGSPPRWSSSRSRGMLSTVQCHPCRLLKTWIRAGLS